MSVTPASDEEVELWKGTASSSAWWTPPRDVLRLIARIGAEKAAQAEAQAEVVNTRRAVDALRAERDALGASLRRAEQMLDAIEEALGVDLDDYLTGEATDG